MHLDLRIDDMAVQTAGKSEKEVVDFLAELAEDLVEMVHQDLRCEIALQKSAVVVSSEALGKKVCTRLGSTVGLLHGWWFRT